MAGEENDERGFFLEQPLAMGKAPPRPAKPARPTEKPHHAGHRDRLRQRFREAGPAALADYELLELLLFRSIPRADTRRAPRRCSSVSERLPKCSARPSIS